MKRRTQYKGRQRSGRRGLFGLGRGSRVRTVRYQVAVPVVRRQASHSLLPVRLVSALLLVVAGWLIYWFSSADAFYIQDVRVEGAGRLSEAELKGLSGLVGVNIFWVNARNAEREIEALPDVESARVACSLPARCVIRVVERPSLFVWQQGNAMVWIGAGGTVLPVRGELPNAVVLDAVASTALKPGDRVDPTLVAAVQELERLQPEVRMYQYTDQFGLSFRNAYGWPVRLGNGDGIQTKLDLSRALGEHLLRRGILPVFIDVRYPEAPYYGEQIE